MEIENVINFRPKRPIKNAYLWYLKDGKAVKVPFLVKDGRRVYDMRNLGQCPVTIAATKAAALNKLTRDAKR